MAEQSAGPFSTRPLPAGQRIALRIEYDGSGYCGWQAQPHLPHASTVQATLEAALAAIATVPVRVHCAGRTDTGVHATAQWVHFDQPVQRSLKSWIVGGNAQLPPEVRIADGVAVSMDFHARHSAVARRYDYVIANTPTAPALWAHRALWVRGALDAGAMHRALQALLGEQDFSAFRAASCQSRTPMRFLESALVRRHGDYLQLRLVANAFLHHMVRNIVGSALEVGAKRQPEAWLGDLLSGRDRTLAAATAGPQGLYLTGVRYPAVFDIQHGENLPFFPD